MFFNIRNLSRAHRVAAQLQAGTVYVNTYNDTEVCFLIIKLKIFELFNFRYIFRLVVIKIQGMDVKTVWSVFILLHN